MPGTYKTRQRARITALLAEHRESHLSAEEIWRLLRERGDTVSRATIYRALDRLVEQGEVRRYAAGDGAYACYQLADEHCSEHYHFRCTACGCVLHVECEHIDAIAAHIREEHGFLLDGTRTVFYGLCADCAKGETP